MDAIHSRFLQLNRRPAVFDREIRQQVNQWYLPNPIPVESIISQFQGNPDFILEDRKVILPLHEPESANLTGEFLIYYPDYVIPSVVYYDYAKDDFSTIPIEKFGETYPAWRLRFWDSENTSSKEAEYLSPDGEADSPSTSSTEIKSDVPLANNGETLIDELRSMITSHEIAERDDARNRCRRLPPRTFLADRGGVEELVTAGLDVDEYGQQIVRFRISDELADDPVDITDEYGIYPGSEVIVDTLGTESGFPVEAEVLQINGRQIDVSFYWDRTPENPDLSVFELESDARFLMGELLNSVPFDRKRDAVDVICENERKRGWLTGETPVSFDAESDISLTKSRLNNSQYKAAYQALSATDVYCIHGPPGTGKTRTLVEIIRAACKDNQRVLAVSHSNQAVDNLLVGDSSENHVDHSSIHGLVVNTDITAARAGGNTSSEFVEEEYVGRDLYQSDVVCATMSGSHQFGENIFDIAVIDEATQATITASLIPVTCAKRIVLAGDHKQLPPYYSGENSEFEDMKISLFEHLVERYGADIVATLKTQYRMNQQIAAFPNNEFYGGELSHGQQNRDWMLRPLSPLEAIRVEGTENQAPSNSYYNELEADVVAKEVEKLLEVGVAPMDIGIITPYSAQIGKIRSALNDTRGLDTSSIKIATVDSFQGSEREAIIVSFVRSNPEGFSGFLTFPNEGPRRLNVALTRARKRCALIGNFDTLRTRAPTKSSAESSSDVYQALYDYLVSHEVLSNLEE